MGFLRHKSEFIEKENTVNIDDLYDAIQRTESYRAEKVNDLKREHSLIVTRIQDLKAQKSSYLRKIEVVTEDDDPLNLSPVIYDSSLDTGTPSLGSDIDVNKNTMIRNPSDPILNYTRTNFTASVAEMDIRLRDYDYQLLKLTQQEQKIVYYLSQLTKLETTAQSASTEQ
jgi:hypothetical protein